jgi:flagellar assembly protein FliH
MSSEGQIIAFEYPPVRESGGAGSIWGLPEDKATQNRADQQMAREERIREIARAEAEMAAKIRLEEELRKGREQLAKVLDDFQRERNRYFETIEAEIVQLALAVARRILHREASIDPDLLAGLVRYSLEKLRDGTKVKARVHPSDTGQMERTFGGRIEIIRDEELAPGTCVLVTEIGSTAINVDEQLKEIEHGLADLLAQRPAGMR